MEETGGTYEIWKGPLSDDGVKQLVRRVQILVPLFIEGGSYIVDQDDSSGSTDLDRWTVFFLYRKDRQGAYTFIGYSSVYRFFYLQKSDSTSGPKPRLESLEQDQEISFESLPCRSRLAQFLILPPFQSQGNGRRLYSTIFEFYHKHHPSTVEFTVEDPNEAFDDLRDLCDLVFLRTLPKFLSFKLNTELDIAKTEMFPKDLVAGIEPVDSVRRISKIAPRQFLRVLEMHLMSKLPASVRPTIDPTKKPQKLAVTLAEKRALRLWKLFVKHRIFLRHQEVLADLEPDVRIEKLDETLRNVEFEYARLLSMHDKWSSFSTAGTHGKRKVPEDSGSSDDPTLKKKARVEDVTDTD